MRIAFCHPNLGIGGAERMIVDAAYGLQERGHDVSIYTSFYNPKRCFEETRHMEIQVFAQSLPDSIPILGAHTVCALIKSFLLTLCIFFHVIFSKEKFEVIIADQIPLPVAFLKILYTLFGIDMPKIYFYCCFPDLLLSGERTSVLKRTYRIPLDMFEEWCISFSDRIIFNSEFTSATSKKTFLSLAKWPTSRFSVIFPSFVPPSELEDISTAVLDLTKKILKGRKFILSINRFERKKAVGRSIILLKELKTRLGNGGFCLIAAGGYDKSVLENKAMLEILVEQCRSLGLTYSIVEGNQISRPDEGDQATDVVFMLTISAEMKEFLLRNAHVLFYTPSNEHFGIVPLEGMSRGCFVIGMASGGLLETVNHMKTGFLIKDKTVYDFGIDIKSQLQFMEQMPENDRTLLFEMLESLLGSSEKPQHARTISQIRHEAKTAVTSAFSFERFVDNMDMLVNQQVVREKKQKSAFFRPLLAFSFYLLLMIVAVSILIAFFP